MTGAYKDGFMGPALPESSRTRRRSDRSLSHMLKRLDENKRELQSHISSLKRRIEIFGRRRMRLFARKTGLCGRLAAGIAHEIGNPIGIILGYLGLLQPGDISEADKKGLPDRMSPRSPASTGSSPVARFLQALQREPEKPWF